MDMKQSFLLALTLVFFLFVSTSCDEENDEIKGSTGTLELKFDNATKGFDNGSLVSDKGSTVFNLVNEYNNNQQYNISVLRYFISEIKLETNDGVVYEEEIEVSANATKGIYLIDEAILSTQRIVIENVPAGDYTKLTFKVGIDSGIVAEGAAGGVLSQGGGAKDTDMFWNWNAGYLAFKMEGQAADSKGRAVGETVTELDSTGYSFHVGGWSTALNNNKVVTLNVDKAMVNKVSRPGIHVIMDVNKVLTGVDTIDFSKTNNIHSPMSGAAMAGNLQQAFVFDHTHQ